MKKSIIVLISSIYILSILFIGFFGMKMTSYNESIYPTEIKIENVVVATYKMQANGMQVITYNGKLNIAARAGNARIYVVFAVAGRARASA